MQKIMFSDRFGLTQAVLEGRKTNTRRIIDAPSSAIYMKPVLDLCGNIIKVYALDDFGEIGVFVPRYKVGEVVAVAQSYKDAGVDLDERSDESLVGCAGWNNKMFTCPALLPNRIRFTGLRVERMQDISDEDCLREGITTITEGKLGVGNAFGWDTKADRLKRESFFSARAAFAALIDKVSGRDTWRSNPWNFAYEFELVK